MKNTIKQIVKEFPESFVILSKDNSELMVAVKPIKSVSTILLAMNESPEVAATICTAVDSFYATHPGLQETVEELRNELMSQK